MRRAASIVGLIVVICGCTAAGATPSASQAGAADGTPPGGQAQPAAGGPNGFEGSLATSGLYSATWTAQAGENPGPFNASDSVTVTSDKGTFGNLMVKPDGSISFGSGATELSDHGLSYDGTGATVTLDATNAFVCSFTVDTDLTSNDGTKLHVAGSMTAHWHPEGIGDLSCP